MFSLANKIEQDCKMSSEDRVEAEKKKWTKQLMWCRLIVDLKSPLYVEQRKRIIKEVSGLGCDVYRVEA